MGMSGGESTPPVTRPTPADLEHPSAPIPVQGRPVGSQVRVPLGESGLQVFPLMLGGAEFGWRVDLPAGRAIMDAYLGLGGNVIHTADSFAGGRSEHIIGRWVRSRGVRDEVVLAVRIGSHPDNPGLDPVNLVRAVEASLTRLDTDRIDVVYLDASGPAALVEDVLATAEWLVESGKARSIGAYAFSASQLVEARILSAAGYPRIDVLDVPLNILRRGDYDRDLQLVVQAQRMALTPSHALEHGYLSGRHRDRNQALRSVRGRQLARSMSRRGTRTLRAMDTVAAGLGVPPAAVAVGWLLAQPSVTAPIVNAYAPEQVTELVQGVGVRLSRAQLAEIARAAS